MPTCVQCASRVSEDARAKEDERTTARQRTELQSPTALSPPKKVPNNCCVEFATRPCGGARLGCYERVAARWLGRWWLRIMITPAVYTRAICVKPIRVSSRSELGGKSFKAVTPMRGSGCAGMIPPPKGWSFAPLCRSESRRGHQNSLRGHQTPRARHIDHHRSSRLDIAPPSRNVNPQLVHMQYMQAAGHNVLCPCCSAPAHAHRDKQLAARGGIDERSRIIP